MNKGMTDMSMKQHILEYIDEAIEGVDDQLQHAFKPENILQDWAEMDIRSSMQRKLDLVKFRVSFESGSTPKGKIAFETYSRIMCEAVETITSFED
jgi:hypothetical protein